MQNVEGTNDLLKRKGVFKISGKVIEENPKAIIAVLKDVLIVGVESNFMTKTLKYSGYSKYFDVVKEGEAIPEYLAAVTDGKLLTVSWQRLNVNESTFF